MLLNIKLNLHTLALSAVAISPFIVMYSLAEAGLKYPEDLYRLINNEPEQWERLFSVLNASSLFIVAALVFINSVLCVFGYMIEKIFFGSFRDSEVKKTMEYSLNFLLLKVIVIWASAQLPDKVPVWKWFSWFIFTGWLSAFTIMCRTRLEYSLTSVHTAGLPQLRVLLLLISIMTINTLVGGHVLSQDIPHFSLGFILLFMFDNVVIAIATARTIVNYLAKWLELEKPDSSGTISTFIYHSDFFFDVAAMSVLLLHYCHIILVHGSLFTMITFILVTKIRSVFRQLGTRLSAHAAYLRIKKRMDELVPMATAEDLRGMDDPCAICQELLEAKACKLACGHIFHKTCLHRWLQQHPSCPICRTEISGIADLGNLENMSSDVLSHLRILPDVRIQFHRFQPRIPVAPGTPNQHDDAIHETTQVPPPQQLSGLVDHVAEMFPHVQRSVIEDILIRTRNVDTTVSYLLDSYPTNATPIPTPHNTNGLLTTTIATEI